jgi:hypothetical protein
MSAFDTKLETDGSKSATATAPALKDIATAKDNHAAQSSEKDRASKAAAAHLGNIEIHTHAGAAVEIDKNGKPIKFEEKGKTWTSTDGKTFTNGAEKMQLVPSKDGDYKLVAASAKPPEKATASPQSAAQIARDAVNNEKIDKQSASDLTRDLSDLNMKTHPQKQTGKVDRNAQQIETDFRLLLSTHNSAQMDQIKKDFQADPTNKGRTLESVIASDSDLSQGTKELANVYLKGNDKRTDADTKELAAKALTARDQPMFQEVMRNATPQARQDFLNNQGEQKVHTAFNGIFSTKDADHAMDYVKYGKLSAMRQIADSTGITKNSESIELALNSMTDHERTLYKTGQQLTDGKTQNLTPEQQQAKEYYTNLHDQINASGNSTQQIKWNDMAANKGGTFVSELADERHMLGANVADVSKRIEDMSQKDWEDLKQHPEKQNEVRKMLSTIDSNSQNVNKYMALYNAKMNDSVKTYADSQNTGLRPLTERLEDSNHWNGADANGMLDTLSKMTQAEKEQLQKDPAYRKEVQDYLQKNVHGTGLDATQRLLNTYIKDGVASKGDILSKLEGLDTKILGDRNEAVRSIQQAFKDDPTLRDRVNNPKTPDEKKYSEQFKTAALNAMGGFGYYQFGKDLIEKGSLPLEQQIKLNKGITSNDYPGAYNDLIHATPDEKTKLQNDADYRNKVIGFMDKDHQQIAMAVLKQGEVKPEDLIRTTALRWGGSSQIVSELGQIKPADLKAAEDSYHAKYGTQLADDVRGKVSGADKVTADRLLAGTLSAEEQARVSQLQTEKSRSGFGAWMADNVFQSKTGEIADEALQQTAAAVADKNKTAQSLAQASDVIKDMTPEQMQALQAHLDSQIITAAGTENKATDDHVEVKHAAANYTADAGIAAVSVGSMILTGGLDTPLVAALAVAGAGIKVGAGKAMEGNDYDSSVGHIASDAAIGSITAVTSALGPGQIAAVFRVGTVAAEGAARVTVANMIQAGAQDMLTSNAQVILEKGGTELLRNTLASGAQKITDAQLTTLASSAVSSTLTGTAREAAVEQVTDQLKQNLVTQMSQGMTAQFGHQALNVGAGATGGGLGSGTEAASNWDPTKSATENMTMIAKATGAGAASGGLGAGGMTAVIGSAKKAIGVIASARDAEQSATIDGTAMLRDVNSPAAETPPDVRPAIRPEPQVESPAIATSSEQAEGLETAALATDGGAQADSRLDAAKELLDNVESQPHSLDGVPGVNEDKGVLSSAQDLKESLASHAQITEDLQQANRDLSELTDELKGLKSLKAETIHSELTDSSSPQIKRLKTARKKLSEFWSTHKEEEIEDEDDPVSVALADQSAALSAEAQAASKSFKSAQEAASTRIAQIEGTPGQPGLLNRVYGHINNLNIQDEAQLQKIDEDTTALKTEVNIATSTGESIRPTAEEDVDLRRREEELSKPRSATSILEPDERTGFTKPDATANDTTPLRDAQASVAEAPPDVTPANDHGAVIKSPDLASSSEDESLDQAPPRIPYQVQNANNLLHGLEDSASPDGALVANENVRSLTSELKEALASHAQSVQDLQTADRSYAQYIQELKEMRQLTSENPESELTETSSPELRKLKIAQQNASDLKDGEDSETARRALQSAQNNFEIAQNAARLRIDQLRGVGRPGLLRGASASIVNSEKSVKENLEKIEQTTDALKDEINSLTRS